MRRHPEHRQDPQDPGTTRGRGVASRRGGAPKTELRRKWAEPLLWAGLRDGASCLEGVVSLRGGAPKTELRRKWVGPWWAGLEGWGLGPRGGAWLSASAPSAGPGVPVTRQRRAAAGRAHPVAVARGPSRGEAGRERRPAGPQRRQVKARGPLEAGPAGGLGACLRVRGWPRAWAPAVASAAAAAGLGLWDGAGRCAPARGRRCCAGAPGVTVPVPGAGPLALGLPAGTDSAGAGQGRAASRGLAGRHLSQGVRVPGQGARPARRASPEWGD